MRAEFVSVIGFTGGYGLEHIDKAEPSGFFLGFYS